MNTISTIKFHFGMQNEDFARSLYTRWEQFYPRNVERVAGEVLDKLRVKNEELRIEKLELDLGNIPEEDFDEQFPLRFREKLEEAVIQWRVESGELRVSRPLSTLNSQLSTEKPLSTLHSQFSILRHFLLHGSLPWYAARECGDIGRLFLNVLRENAGELKKFLQTCGHYTSLQQRLVYQLGDPELEKGVHLLAPGAGVFIVAYVRFLHAKYSETEQPQATRSNHRDAVWQVVYAYLLTQRSSYFDKKSFVTQTIIRLAARYNLSYESLLTRLTGELEAFRKRLTIPLELFQLLASLQGELSERQLKESFIDAAKFYRTLYPSIKKEMDGQVSADSREGLMRILANPYACRQFLQHLSEPEIIRLVPLIIPHDSDFVIKTAKAMESGELISGELRIESGEWRAEGGFHSPLSTLHSPLIKWSIIFPVLLEKRGTRFNRKQFIRAVLKQVAAHYNLDVRLLMESLFQQDERLAKMDKELRGILRELRVENGELRVGKGELGVENGELRVESGKLGREDADAENGASRLETGEPLLTGDAFDSIMQLIAEDSSLSITGTVENALSPLHPPLSTLNSQFSTLLSALPFRKKLISQTRDPQRYRLIRLMYPGEQDFIISYIKSLDRLPGNSSLEAKAGGSFAGVKWMFLFAVLSEMPADSFNRRSFVSRVLQQVAAHYNLAYFDLLRYFHQGKTGMQLPSHLEQLLGELYAEEREHWMEMMLRNGQETVKYQYLSCFREVDTAFVKTFLQTLDSYHGKGVLQGKTSGRLNELKWRFVFEVLLEFPAVAFNKKQFVRRALARMAAHYQLSLYELLAYLKEVSAVPGYTYSKEVEKIIRELYSEQPEGAKTQNPAGAKAQSPESKKTQKHEAGEAPPKANQPENSPPSTLHSPFINNAGVVLLAPYLPRLFSMLDLTENGSFRDSEAQIKAICLIQFIVFGTTAFPEHEMVLNKLLTGFETEAPLPRDIELTEKETDTVLSMLNAALQHWSKLKNTSIDGLREGFLQREGKLEEKEDFYLLTVEEKAYDMLLDSCPWNFRTVKFSWMKKVVQVKWR